MRTTHFYSYMTAEGDDVLLPPGADCAIGPVVVEVPSEEDHKSSIVSKSGCTVWVYLLYCFWQS